jgi:hypothetical protein
MPGKFCDPHIKAKVSPCGLSFTIAHNSHSGPDDRAAPVLVLDPGAKSLDSLILVPVAVLEPQWPCRTFPLKTHIAIAQ